MTTRHISLRINDELVEGEVEPRMSLADFIRDIAVLKGTRVGCEHGVCGTCTVQLDGEAVRSCLLFAVQAERRDVRTVEALSSTDDDTLHPLQEAFHQEHALQCGFCTSGILMSLETIVRDADAVLGRAVLQDALGGNLCRCTGYLPILTAAERAFQSLRGGSEPPATPEPTSSPTSQAD